MFVLVFAQWKFRKEITQFHVAYANIMWLPIFSYLLLWATKILYKSRYQIMFYQLQKASIHSDNK